MSDLKDAEKRRLQREDRLRALGFEYPTDDERREQLARNTSFNARSPTDDPHRGKRRHVQFKMRADLYGVLKRLWPRQSVDVTARNILERFVEIMEEKPDE